jgi:hypothetical protein
MPNKPKKNRVKQNKPTMFGKLLKAGGTIAGSYFGNPTLGSAVGAGISRIFGQGDYKIVKNTVLNGGPPAFAAVNTGIRISHREYVTDVLSSIDYANQTFEISPTNEILFPWLSKIAYNFEEYKIHGIVLYFNTTCGNAVSSTNNALGVIGMTTVYDPTDLPLPNKREAEDYAGCTAGVPSMNILHPVECKPRSNVLDRLYIQTSDLLDPEDKKFYVHGVVNLFRQGMQSAGINIGELWVSYDIEFFNPKVLPLGSVGSAGSHMWGTGLTGVTATKAFGGIDIPNLLGNLNCKYQGSTGDIIIPAGTSTGVYLVSTWAQYSASTAASYTMSVVTPNISPQISFFGDTQTLVYSPLITNASTDHSAMFMFRKTDVGEGRFRFGTNVIAGSSCACDIIVIKMPNSLTSIFDLNKLTKGEIEILLRRYLSSAGQNLNLEQPSELDDKVESCSDI